MKILGKEVNVNILEELDPYLVQFRDYKIRGEKLQACSPFREDNHPSFAVNLVTGVFIDSGNDDLNYYKGDFVKLLAYLRQESYEDASMYLIDKYNIELLDVDTLSLNINLVKEQQVYKTFDWATDLKYLHYRVPYLGKRGISEKVQRAFKIGYDNDKKAVAIPWQDVNGQIVNVKFRNVNSKKFSYLEDGQLTRYHVYGLYQCIKYGFDDVVLVESETDCLYLWSNSIPAIAVGHAGLHPLQLKLLRKYVKSITIGSDNDSAGNRFRQELITELPKYFTTYNTLIPRGYKDMNDLPPALLHEVVTNREIVSIGYKC